MQKRYPASHIISLLFKVLPVVTFIIGIILMFAVLWQGTFLPLIFGSSLLNLGAAPILLFSLMAAPAAITPPVETPTAQPAPITNPPEESGENKAAAMAQRKQNIKDILNKRLWYKRKNPPVCFIISAA
jgi:hypothetical protein